VIVLRRFLKQNSVENETLPPKIVSHHCAYTSVPHSGRKPFLGVKTPSLGNITGTVLHWI